jgi:DNA-binding beta-propeller fold protein YncE
VLDRREFLGDTLQVLAGWVAASGPVRGGGAPAAPRHPLRALVTADTEAHVAVVSLSSHEVIRRIATVEGPRSIQATGRGRAIVGHADAGAVTVIEDGKVRRVLRGFGQPRYTAVHGNRAYVTDGATGEVAVLDLARARVLRRVAVGDAARHITIDPKGRTLWVALGSSAPEIVIVDLDGWRQRRIRPPFLAHDVAFSPSGDYVWVTAGREPRTAVYHRQGGPPARLFDGDKAPQHVTFGPTSAYIASGEGAVVTVRSLLDQRILRKTKVPFGSYNVQRGAGRVLTPSLGTGALTILDPRGRISAQIDVARNAHDVCVA